jgi:hypothetical protein
MPIYGGGSSLTASGVVLSGTYASRPAAGTAGRVYLCTDSDVQFRDNGSTWDAFWNGMKLTPPVAGNFAWNNQDDATLDTSGPVIWMTDPANASLSLHLQKITAPATPWTVTALIRGSSFRHGSGASAFGMAYRQSSDGKLHQVYVSGGGDAGNFANLFINKWSSSTAFAAHYAGFPNGLAEVPLWFRLADNGTNRIISLSLDGIHWTTIHTIGRTDYMTADEVGWFGAAYGHASMDMRAGLYSWAVG